MAHLLQLVGDCATSTLGRHALDRGSFEARIERFPHAGSQIDISIEASMLNGQQVGFAFQCRDGMDVLAEGSFMLTPELPTGRN